jgi:hypothetical protein
MRRDGFYTEGSPKTHKRLIINPIVKRFLLDNLQKINFLGPLSISDPKASENRFQAKI